MQKTITAKTLRADLQAVLDRVRRGERFTVLYRNRAVCRLVPIEETEEPLQSVQEDPLYRAEAVGRSADGLAAADHDAVLYGQRG